MASKRALITGITGQDGSYLAELLLEKGYEVHGMVRRASTETFQRLEGIRDAITLHTGDLLDQRSLVDVMRECEPEEIYNLAAMSFVAASWSQPVLTAEFTAVGRDAHPRGDARGHARRALLPGVELGDVRAGAARCRSARRRPSTRARPYGVAKCYAHFITVNYRESYDLYAGCGILFNHESERRGLEFVTRKVTHAAAAIKLGLQTEVALGNLDAERDWGYAKDYVEAMWLMLQEDEPDDYVIATGEAHSRARARGRGVRARRARPRATTCASTRSYLRPAEVEHLIGDPQQGAREARLECRAPASRRW